MFRLRSAIPPTNDPLAMLRVRRMDRAGIRDRAVAISRTGNSRRRIARRRSASTARCIVGTPIPVTDRNREALAAALPTFKLTLRRDAPSSTAASAPTCSAAPRWRLRISSRVLAAQPQFPPLAPGEIVTTGTVTDAWPVAAGETWASDYGALGIGGMTVEFS